MNMLPAQVARQNDGKIFPKLGMLLALLLTYSAFANAQHWTAVTPFPGSGAGTAILLTDGSVLVEEITGPGGTATGNYYVLVPTNTGDYSKGFWGGPTTLPSGYAPQFFGSAVLPDSRVIIEGGEYNFGVQDDITKGVAFDQLSGAFTTSISPPSGWSTIGDAPTVVLANGRFMMGDCCSAKQALFDAKTLTWSSIGTGKADPNSEEGWTLLPAATGNKVLTVDTQNGTQSELFDPTPPGTWSLAGNTPFFLGNNCGLAIVPEMGPAVLRPDGTVFQVGANGKTAIYNSSTGKWSAGPSFPSGLGVADGPAAILPDGNVLIMASSISPCFSKPAQFYEFNGQSLAVAPNPPNAQNEASFNGRMLVLPNGGHILLTDGTQDVESYIPKGAAKSSWLPTLTSFPSTITQNGTYTFKGTQLNGLSQGAAYGDDAQMATNFPLVRLSIGGFTYYLPTSNFSTMGVATGATVVSAQFTLPFFVGTGPATAVVVTNGLTSKSVSLTVK